MKCTAAILKEWVGLDSKVWFWLVSTREAYAEGKEANKIAGQTKENTDKQIVLLIIFIIHLTNITESKPKCKVTYILTIVNI